jgi:hypothetical protein
MAMKESKPYPEIGADVNYLDRWISKMLNERRSPGDPFIQTYYEWRKINGYESDQYDMYRRERLAWLTWMIGELEIELQKIKGQT